MTSMKLQIKWGADGSSGLQRYHQKPAASSEDLAVEDGGTVFIISMVPLILKGVNETATEEVIVWKNPSPSSYRWCRPIKMLYKKENSALIRQEIDDIRKQISGNPFHRIRILLSVYGM